MKNISTKLKKIYKILPKKSLLRLPIVIIAMVIGAGFEVLSLSLIIPLLEIISGSNNMLTDFLKSYLYTNDLQKIAFICLASFVLIFIFRSIYLSILAWIIASFIYSVKAHFSNTLIKKYLIIPYEFHLNNNSAQLIRNLTIETNNLVLFVLNPLMIIISESVVVMAIGVFLLTLELQATIIVAILIFIFSFAFHYFIGGHIERLGEMRLEADGKIIQNSQETLGGIKDIKVLDKEMYFYERFGKNNLISANSSSKQIAFSKLPRIYLETLGVLTFSIFIFLLMGEGNGFNKIIPIVGVFAFASFRIIPSANRILVALNNLSYADSVVTILHAEIETFTSGEFKDDNSKMGTDFSSFQHGIEVIDVSYQYPKSSDVALSCFNLKIKKGETIGILGESGSGKSTLVNLILGLLKPKSGIIRVDDVDIHRNIKNWHSLIGYVQQEIFLLDDTILKNIVFDEIDSKIDYDKINNSVNESQLTDFIASLPEKLNTKVGERGIRLSGGQKQRIAIARALYRNSPILIFDEATSALDIDTEFAIMSTIKNLKNKKTIIIITHRPSTLDFCDKIIKIKSGHIVK